MADVPVVDRNFIREPVRIVHVLRGMAVYSFAIEVMVRGYHVYQSIWDAANDGEELEGCREVGNIHDPSAVAIRKDSVIVGHVYCGLYQPFVQVLYAVEVWCCAE